MPVHVGLNLVYLTPGRTGGTEVYARELIPRLVAAAPQDRFTAFVNRDAAGSPGPWTDTVEQVVVPVSALNRMEWVRGEQFVLPRLARRHGVELLHSLANTAPAWGPFRRIVTVHDLIYEVVPEARRGLRAQGMRILAPLAAKRSNRVIVDASATRGDLHQYLGLSADKVDVVPLGLGAPQDADPVPEVELRRRLEAGDRQIVLSVSAKLPHKNLLRLLAALAEIPALTRPLLVLPGYPTPHEADLRSRAAQLDLSDAVRFLGWISNAELEGLYQAAACFVFPSLYEGFGLPVLEAMCRGLPVACSDRGALAEVAGDAALLFDPQSVPDIARALETLLQSPNEAQRLSAAGQERAQHFSWAATAAGTLSSYRRAVSHPA